MKKFYRFVACLLSFVLCVSLAPREVRALDSTVGDSIQESNLQDISFAGFTIRSEEDYEDVKEAWETVAPLDRKCDRYSLLFDAEKDKILELYDIAESVMEGLEELGFSLSISAQYARVMNTYDLSMEEVVQAADMFGDVNLLAVELHRFGEFVKKTELSQEMIEHVRAMILEGHEYVTAVHSYMAAEVMQADAATVSASSGVQSAPVRRSLLSDQQEELSEEEIFVAGEEVQGTSASAIGENIEALSEFYAIEPEILQEYLDETAMDTEEFEELVQDATRELYSAEEESTSLSQNQLSSTSAATYSMALNVGEEEEDVVSAPFTYQRTEQESVNLNTGDYTYEETDLVLPGKNGLDLVLTRRFDSSDSNTEIPWGFINNPNAVVYTLKYAYYLQGADQNDMECYESNRISSSQYNRYTWNYADLATNFNPVVLHEAAMVSGVDSYDGYIDQDDGIWYYWDDFIIKNMSIQFRLKDRNYMMQCIAQTIEPMAFSATDTATGDTISILAQPEIIVNEAALANAAFSGTSSLVNAYSQNRYGLGIGWSYAFTSIDEYFDVTDNFGSYEKETHFMLNLADGRKFRVNFENGDTAEIEGYLKTDMVLTVQNQGGSNQTYTLKYADGKTETLNKDGYITQIKDRYNNSINFAYEYAAGEYNSLNRVKKMTITDTLGRIVTLDDFQNNSSKRILTAPDGTTKEFTLSTDSSNGVTHKYLTEAKDENDCVTEYVFKIVGEQFNVFSPYPLAGLEGTIYWRYLRKVTFATNDAANIGEEEPWQLCFEIKRGSLRCISNGVGHQGYIKLASRYISTDKIGTIGDKRIGLVEYVVTVQDSLPRTNWGLPKMACLMAS
jgi:hypothetical protein